MFGLVHLIHNSKQILFAPKNVPIVCFRYQRDCHSFGGFTRHFYSCQYLACQKRGKGEEKGGFENKWITGHSGDSKTIEKTILLNTLTKRKLKYSGEMYIVLYRMQIWTKIV